MYSSFCHFLRSVNPLKTVGDIVTESVCCIDGEMKHYNRLSAVSSIKSSFSNFSPLLE